MKPFVREEPQDRQTSDAHKRQTTDDKLQEDEEREGKWGF